MMSHEIGWAGLQKQDGSTFLAWIQDERKLSLQLDNLAKALSSLLHEIIRTPAEAHDVWKAVPAVLGRCNEQATYEKPGAAPAYAWLHLLERYVRTWLALERLVENACLAMGKDGVRALDVGTGPGPAAFAIHDFYAAMVEFSEIGDDTKWRQPSHVTCIEFDPSTNHLRHQLAEVLFQQTKGESEGVLSMCSALWDFGSLEPAQERKRRFEYLRSEEHEYFDDVAGHLCSDPIYFPDEAHDIAQSLHRYRLVVFSNFLTTLGTVKGFGHTLVDVLRDARPGTLVLVLGGTRGVYHEIYDYVDRLAELSGFQLTVEGDTVALSDTEVARKVYETGRAFYEFLQGLVHNDDHATKKVRTYFEGELPTEFHSSEMRAYRKW